MKKHELILNRAGQGSKIRERERKSKAVDSYKKGNRKCKVKLSGNGGINRLHIIIQNVLKFILCGHKIQFQPMD